MLTILRFILIFVIGVAGVFATNILSFFGDTVWFLDYLSHFRLQYLVLLAGLMGIFWVFGMRLFLGATVVLLLINLYDYSYIYRHAAPSAAPADKTFTIMSFNQWHFNEEYADVLRAVQQSKADIVLIHESSTPMLQVLQQAQWLYPYQHPLPERRGHSSAILSKYPWKRLHYEPFAGMRALVVTFDSGGAPLTVVGVHPYSPVTKERKTVRDNHLRAVARFAEHLSTPVIIAGDFNATPWSGIFREFIDISGLHTTVAWGQFMTTWPAWLPAFLQIPIDHIFVSKHFGVLATQRLGSFGSDHYAIQSTLVLQHPSP